MLATKTEVDGFKLALDGTLYPGRREVCVAPLGVHHAPIPLCAEEVIKVVPFRLQVFLHLLYITGGNAVFAGIIAHRLKAWEKAEDGGDQS